MICWKMKGGIIRIPWEEILLKKTNVKTNLKQCRWCKGSKKIKLLTTEVDCEECNTPCSGIENLDDVIGGGN